ncbi:hypothetical protein ERJ75_001395300 [Trypanosoma vivax]|nr:hypothetical protein ERJ75_001395300 [Trypanosoma vivax]
MHKLALAVFCVIAARTSQRALAGEPNAGDTVEDFRKVCVATHALGAVKSLSEAIAGRVKEVTASARGVGTELEGQLRIKRSAMHLVAKLAPTCIDDSRQDNATRNASEIVVCAADAIADKADKMKNAAETHVRAAIEGRQGRQAQLTGLATAMATESSGGWGRQARAVWDNGLETAMIYLCNNAHSGSNGCGTTTEPTARACRKDSLR